MSSNSVANFRRRECHPRPGTCVTSAFFSARFHQLRGRCRETGLDGALRRGPWRHLEDVEFATLEWVAWFNTRRLLEPIGYVPPAEYEATYYRRQETPADLATLT